MVNLDPSGPTSAEFSAFVETLSQVFHGESWDEIEPYAERVWEGCGFEQEQPWEEVRSRVEDEWNERLLAVLQTSIRLRSNLGNNVAEGRAHAKIASAKIRELQEWWKQR